MIGSDDQEALMVRYLLGLSTEEERTRVEERYFSESEYFDRMLALEDSLIDDYVTGRMPPERQRAFRGSFSLRGEDVRFSHALIQGITKKKLDAPLAPEPMQLKRKRQWSIGRPPPRSGVAVAISIAALVFLAISVALFIMNQSLRNKLSQSEARCTELAQRNGDAQQELEQERSGRELSARELEIERNRRIEAENALRRQGRPDSPNDSSDFRIILGAAFLPRGAVGSPQKQVRLPGGVLWVRLHIPLKGLQGYESYRVSLRAAGEPVIFEKGSLRATGSGANAFLVVRIEREKLKADDYILSLQGETARAVSATLNEYSFRVVN